MLYGYLLMDVREEEGEYYYTVCSAFDSKYAKELKSSMFLASVKRQEICNVKISKKVEMFANFHMAVSEFINTYYVGEKLLVIEKNDLQSKRCRYFKFFTENGVNITLPIYQIVGRHLNYVLDENNIALGVKMSEPVNDSIDYVAEVVDMINRESRQTLYDNDIIKQFIFLN